MTSSLRIRHLAAAALATAACAPGAADAAGGPLNGFDAGNGATNPANPHRWVTFATGRWTVLARVARAGGTVDGYRYLRGAWGIPTVSYDGSGAGLTADGRRLVLIERPARFPQRRIRLTIVDARRLRVIRTITLAGVYSFDAVSPDGAKIYLVKYVSAASPARYSVRTFDVARNRLLARPVVDRRNPRERMRGFPITRATTADGAWAYTLYDGGGDAPFIHALNTVAGTASCIDLDALSGRNDLFSLRLRLDRPRHRLAVVDSQKSAVLFVDTRSFAVTRPGSAPHRAPQSAARTGNGAAAVAVIGAICAAALLIAAQAARRKRRAHLKRLEV